RLFHVTGVQTCALPISTRPRACVPNNPMSATTTGIESPLIHCVVTDPQRAHANATTTTDTWTNRIGYPVASCRKHTSQTSPSEIDRTSDVERKCVAGKT